jgi:hypothetical protein
VNLNCIVHDCDKICQKNNFNYGECALIDPGETYECHCVKHDEALSNDNVKCVKYCKERHFKSGRVSGKHCTCHVAPFYLHHKKVMKNFILEAIGS